VKVTDEVVKVGKRDVQFRKIKCKFDSAPPARIEVGMTVTVEGTVRGKGFWTGTIGLDTVAYCRSPRVNRPRPVPSSARRPS